MTRSKEEDRRKLRAAQARYERLHWGEPAPRDLSTWLLPDPRKGPLVELGVLLAVEYETEKTGDGLSVYRHDFGDKRGRGCPVLAVTSDRRLVIAGGKYTVQSRGIVG